MLATTGVTPCVRFFRRPDGSVMTAACPDRANRRRAAAAIAAGATAGAVAIASRAAALLPRPETLRARPEQAPEPRDDRGVLTVDIPDREMVGVLAAEPLNTVDPPSPLPAHQVGKPRLHPKRTDGRRAKHR